MKTKDPDDLLAEMNLSIMPKAFLIAFTIHAAIILGTSFGLYRDWWGWNKEKTAYGFLATPSTINFEKQKVRRAAKEEADKAAAAERAAEREAALKAAEEKKASRPQANAQSGETADNAPGDAKEPELQPLPPAKSFTLDDNFDL